MTSPIVKAIFAVEPNIILMVSPRTAFNSFIKWRSWLFVLFALFVVVFMCVVHDMCVRVTLDVS